MKGRALRYDIARLVGVAFACIALLSSCKSPQESKSPQETVTETRGQSFVSWKEFSKNPDVLENELRLDEANATCLDGGSYTPKTTEKLNGACNYAKRNQGPYSIEIARFDKSGKPFNAHLSFHPPIELEKLPSVLDIDEGWVAPERIMKEGDGSIIKVFRDVRAPIAKQGELLKMIVNVRDGLVLNALLEFNTFEKEEDIYKHRLDLGEPLVEAEHVVPLYFGPSRKGDVHVHDIVVRLTPSAASVNGVLVEEGGDRSLRGVIEEHIKRHVRGSARTGATPAKMLLSPSHTTPWNIIRHALLSTHQHRSDDHIGHLDLSVARAPSFEYEVSQWYAAALEMPKAEVGALEDYKASGGEVVIYLEPDAVYFELSGKLSATTFGAPSNEHVLRYDPKACSKQESFDATACLKPYINSDKTDNSILGQIAASSSKFETGASATTSVDFEGHSKVLSGYAPHKLGETIEYLLASIEKKHGKRPNRVAVRPHEMLSAQVVLSMLDVIQGNVEGMNVKGECDGVLEEKIKPLHWRRCEAPRLFSRVFFAID